MTASNTALNFSHPPKALGHRQLIIRNAIPKGKKFLPKALRYNDDN